MRHETFKSQRVIHMLLLKKAIFSKLDVRLFYSLEFSKISDFLDYTLSCQGEHLDQRL